MKYLFTTILVLGFCLVSNAQTLQDLEAFFKPKQAFIKPITAKTYFLEDAFKCSNTLILNSDSTFLREIGCEGHSFVTVGNWRQFKDSIELKAVKQSEIDLISAVETTDNVGDSTVTFYFTDKLGQPICSARLIESFFIMNNPRFRGRGSAVGKDLKTDSNGIINFKKSEKWDSLNFYRFHAFTGKPLRIAFKNLPSKIHIQLNINYLGLIYSDLKYYYFDKPKAFKYTDDALITDFNVWKRIEPD
jgi:hypothetical protein